MIDRLKPVTVNCLAGGRGRTWGSSLPVLHCFTIQDDSARPCASMGREMNGRFCQDSMMPMRESPDHSCLPALNRWNDPALCRVDPVDYIRSMSRKVRQSCVMNAHLRPEISTPTVNHRTRALVQRRSTEADDYKDYDPYPGYRSPSSSGLCEVSSQFKVCVWGGGKRRSTATTD